MKLILTLFATLPLLAWSQIALDIESSSAADIVDCGNHSSLNITGNTLTLEAWIKPESIPANIWEGNVINKSGAGDQGYMMRIGGANQVNFNIGDFGWNEVTSPANVISTGSWYHIACVYNGSNMIIYVNGAQVASNTVFFGNIGSASNNLWFGDDPVWNGRYYDGVIEEVKIWNIARTPAEVIIDMEPILCSPYPNGLVAYYKFNEGSPGGNNAALNNPNNIIDEIGNNHGSLLNSSYSGGSSNWVTGRPDPVANPSFTLSAINCNNADATLSGTAGGTFSWNPNPVDGSALNTTTGEITNGIPGSNYTIDYTVCGLTSTESIILPSNGDATFSLTPQCGGGTATISGDPGGVFTFNPAPGDGALLNTGSGLVTYATAGTTYTIEYTICGTTSSQNLTVIDDNCWTLNDDAQYINVAGEQCIQLTDELNDQTGCAWNSQQIDFASSFSLTLDYYFGNNINGADGNTFTFQPSSSTACGSPGAQLGSGGISNALSIEFDTYDNDNPMHVYDMACDHIAVEIDGNHQGAAPFCGPVCAKASGASIDDGGTYTVDITWDPVSQDLEIYFDGVLRLTCNHDFINNVFGGQSEVYWGATSATGGLNNEQYFCPSTVVILPVELSSFESACNDKSEIFEWTSVTEQRVDYYSLEYSYDGLVFLPEVKIDAVGNSQQEQYYSAEVTNNDPKQRYYRLRVVDTDGHVEYTELISSKRCAYGNDIITGVSQSATQIIISTKENVALEMINPIGQVIHTTVSNNHTTTVPKRLLSDGVYIVNVRTDLGEFQSKKIFVQM